VTRPIGRERRLKIWKTIGAHLQESASIIAARVSPQTTADEVNRERAILARHAASVEISVTKFMALTEMAKIRYSKTEAIRKLAETVKEYEISYDQLLRVMDIFATEFPNPSDAG
jgi:hypothetical protein